MAKVTVINDSKRAAGIAELVREGYASRPSTSHAEVANGYVMTEKPNRDSELAQEKARIRSRLFG